MYPGECFAEHSVSLLFFLSLLWSTHTHPGAARYKNRAGFGAFSAPRASLKGLLLSPLAYRHPSRVRTFSSFFPPGRLKYTASKTLSFRFAFSVACVNLRTSSERSNIFKHGLEKVVDRARVGVPRVSFQLLIGLAVEAQHLSALNLTDGILFLERHKLVWERG